VTRYEGATGRKEIVHATSRSGDLESFSTELGELVPRGVACPVSMLHSGVDVIESKFKFHRHWARASACHPGGLTVAVSRVKRERPDRGIEGNRAWKAFANR
jgi:hypothetical protein